MSELLLHEIEIIKVRYLTADNKHQPTVFVRPCARDTAEELHRERLLTSLDTALIRAYAYVMQTLPISKVKDRLNDLVDAASITHEQVTITKNGTPAAVLIGMDEWESLQETLFWLSQPEIRESIGEAKVDVAAGRVYTQEQIRAEFNIPTRNP